MNSDIKIFLDSGAFSAFTQNIEIKIEDYINFVKQHEKYLHVYSNLDAIGNPEATWKNQKIMERAGLQPIPTFHYGSNIKWLKKLLSKYNYIALGGMVPVSTRDLTPWLDDLFQNHLCDKDGMPVVRVHGFGMTSLRLMFRYPWFSVDSTSWIFSGKLGQIYVPMKNESGWNYLTEPMKVTISIRSPSMKDKGKHFNSMSPKVKSIVLNYIQEKGFPLGKSEIIERNASDELAENEKWIDKKSDSKKRRVEVILEPGLSNDYKMRDKINIQYFIDLEKEFPKWPWKFELKTRRMGFEI